jgi:hypothetical protein
VGEELEALRELYLEAEDKALKGEAKLFTENWEGDVYVGSGWNVATVLALVSAVTTLGGLVFAFATKGVVSCWEREKEGRKKGSFFSSFFSRVEEREKKKQKLSFSLALSLSKKKKKIPPKSAMGPRRLLRLLEKSK